MHRAFVSRCVTQRSSHLVASAARGAHCRQQLHHQIPGLRSTEARSNPRRSFGKSEIMAEAGSGEAANSSDDVVVQYVVLRRDLWKEMDWPLGSVVAQACHAATAVLWQCRDDDVVGAYCSPENLDSMHKVVLEIKGETQLRNLSAKLEEAGVQHKLWIEQPEDFATCIATKPYPKSEVSSFFKKLQLCKGK